jgi:F0F1-type ATP synthase membrane subunit b/b'
MRCLLIFAVLASMPACQRTPEQQHADALRSDARQRGAAIENRANVQADRLQQQASDLKNQASQAGGMTGERLRIRANALDQESKVIRKQADMQADAIKEDADARIKASKSR